MELSAVEIRILGCLVEKAATTPDNYPLSTNALVNACNQSSNRDPVVNYDEKVVDQTVLDLRTAGLARTVTGGRANKHRHVLDEAWGLSPTQLSLLAVLFLRGPQTVGELRSRTERMSEFADLDAVEQTLGELTHGQQPYVAKLDRVPGQKERRWTHLVEGDPTVPAPTPADPSAAGVGGDPAGDTLVPDGDGAALAPPAPSAPAPRTDDDSHVVSGLKEQVDRLRDDVDRLYMLLGETPEARE